MVKNLYENLPRFRSWDCPLAVAMRTSSKFDKGDPVNFAKPKHYESGYLMLNQLGKNSYAHREI